jgi:Tfp pilus assembly protein PilF
MERHGPVVALASMGVVQAMTSGSDDSQQHYALGRAYKARNEFAAAEQEYRHALQIHPDYFDAWISLGILLRNLGRLAEAEACQREAVRIDPNHFLAMLNLGNALFAQGRLEEAARWFRQAVERSPHSAEAQNNLGRALLRLKEIVQAAQHFSAALKINFDYFEAAEGLGICLFQAGRFEHAAEALAHASRLRPGSIETRLFLARASKVARNLEAAAAEYRRLLDEHPDLPEAQCGLAVVFATRGEYASARVLFEQAIAARPGDAYTRLQYGSFLLRNGEYANAWDYYESRWHQAYAGWVDAIDRKLPQPRWQGEPLAGKALLVTCEQGLGDEIMFASIVPDIIRESGHCIVECDARLESLFRRSFPSATVFGVNRREKDWQWILAGNLPRLPSFDRWTPSGTLPCYRRTATEHFPRHSGYLVADGDRKRHWQDRLRELGAGPKIGIGWRGGVPISNTAARSVTLEQLRPLLDTQGVHFVNLQYGDCRGEIDSFTAASGIAIHHWQEAIDDYDETAALVCALDLVISVCTSVVHLGGALGRPVWVMAPRVPEWRYGAQGPAMIWYPSVRMFRQPQLDAWDAVISQVKDALLESLAMEFGKVS